MIFQIHVNLMRHTVDRVTVVFWKSKYSPVFLLCCCHGVSDIRHCTGHNISINISRVQFDWCGCWYEWPSAPISTRDDSSWAECSQMWSGDHGSQWRRNGDFDVSHWGCHWSISHCPNTSPGRLFWSLSFLSYLTVYCSHAFSSPMLNLMCTIYQTITTNINAVHNSFSFC